MSFKIFSAKRNTIYSLVFVLFLASFIPNVLKAQSDQSGTWYFKDPGGEVSSRVVITKDFVTYENYQNYQVDKPFWKKDKEIALDNRVKVKNGFRLIGQENGKFYGGDFWFNDDKKQLYIFQMRESGNSEKAVNQLLDKKANKALLSRVAYEKTRLEEIQSFPSLDKLVKKDVIQILNHMYSFEGTIAESGEEQRIIWRMGQNILNRKFISMGFDPDKPTEGYFMKRFIDDPDIVELVKKQVHLKMY